MKHHLLTAVFVLAGLGLVAVTNPAAADKKDEDWGTIKGQVVYDAETAPEPKVINVDKDKEHCLSKGDLFTQDLVVNKKNKGVRWTFVWLAPQTSGAALKVHPALQKIKDPTVELDQPCCMFEPRALGMRQGQKLVAKNTSPIAHNINWTGGPKNAGNNVIIPAKQSYSIDDLVADKYPVKIACNIHPWMGGWVRVFDHPYFAVTDENGKFEIKSAPAGEYNLVFWHERVGYVPQGNRTGIPVTVKGGGSTDTGDIKFKPPTD